jgi:3-phenylpropionate/trans-cinnamate dioxygenase ferredoxin subunit
MGCRARVSVTKYVICRADEIEPGRRKLITVAGRPIGVFNVGGEFFALLDRCPHQGGPLCSGQLWGAVRAPVPGVYEYSAATPLLRCPWHGWEFDVRTGQSWFNPDKMAVRRYPVTLESAPAEREKGPYVAEIYPVSVEEQIVVVEI